MPGETLDDGAAPDAAAVNTAGSPDAGPPDAGPPDAGPNDSDAAQDDGESTAASPAGTPDAGAWQDPGPPYLLVDLYSGDHTQLVGDQPDWPVLAASPGYVGAILKAWEGLSFHDGGWFQRHWPAVRDAGAGRYGVSWFRGAYLFLLFARGGADQADAYVRAVDAAGGWGGGDIHPIIDVELGHDATLATDGTVVRPAHPNQSASKQQVIDCAAACADRMREVTGRRVILYGRRAMHHLGIVDKMGCDLVWNPSYTPAPHLAGLEAWNPADIVLWQYRGDKPGSAPGLPQSIPGFGACDMSVVQNAGGAATLQYIRDTLLNAGD